MILQALQEMLELNEAEAGSLVAKFKQGYNNQKNRHAEAEAKIKAAYGEAEAKLKSAKVEAEQKAKRAKQEAADKAKIQPQEIADDISQWLEDFFSKFPNLGGSDGGKELALRYPSPEGREVTAAAFKALANRVEQLRVKFNESLVRQKLVLPKQISKFNRQARAMMGADAPSPPAQLIKFVKSEAKFFKGLVRVKNNAELNDEDFKEILSLKIKQTATERVPDAAQALNMLFGYMVSEFTKHARAIQKIVRDTDDSETSARLAARNAPPASPGENEEPPQ